MTQPPLRLETYSEFRRNVIFDLIVFRFGTGPGNYGAVLEFVALVVGLRIELQVLFNRVRSSGNGRHCRNEASGRCR